MPHPKIRTWTLGTLDRERGYWLYFDPSSFRWEVRPGEDPAAGPLTTRQPATTATDHGGRAFTPDDGAAAAVTAA